MADRNDDELLADLLIQWEERRDQGQEVSAEELCRTFPHLANELARRIHALKVTSWLDNPEPGEGVQTGLPATTDSGNPRILAGRYRLDRLHAEGGFAEVWRAFDLELQRVVAVKLPRGTCVGSAERFTAEARKIARLKHPGIVSIFDVGREGDCYFLVTEYVEGGSLAQRLPVSPADAARIVAEVADALHYAHRQGFVHRDIKPGNVLLDTQGRALLTDFGIALAAGEAPGSSFGTLRYMAPEQAGGHAADTRSDIYSLGAVLHELLTGRLPYRATEPAALRREVVGGPADISVPGELGRICRKALERNPADRYATAGDMAADLRRVQFRPRAGAWKWGGVLALLLAGTELAVWSLRRGGTAEGGPSAQRLAAEAVLRRGGTVKVTVGPRTRQIGSVADLPAEPFSLYGVTLSGPEPVDDVLRRLQAVSSLTELNFLRVELGPDSLALLKSMNGLGVLRFNETPVPVGGLRHVEGLPLHFLDLRPSRLTDADLPSVGKLRGLEWLDLSSNPVTDAGIAHLKHLSALKELRLNNTLLTDKGVAAFAGAASLEVLEVRATKVSDDGMREIGRLRKLAILDLTGTAVGDAGLLKWEKPPGLTQLRLNGQSGVTDEGLRGLDRLKRLTVLELRGTRVTDAGCEALRKALPGCQIVR